ncbi:MAG: UDP-N-acetylmuramoyl-tripeptide--D-alanyl-D-alanine ligase [Burkholderiaceae bacterium]
MKATLSELLPQIPGATLAGDAVFAGNTAFDGISTDSRQLAPGSLFVALRGERFDAHDFLGDVAAAPVAAIMAERAPEGIGKPVLLVPDTRAALGVVARWWRQSFAIPVIGVTGSNGKTTVKEMIAAILAAAFGEDGRLATRGNFNNEIGLPLTLFRLEAAHRAAVVELGMNHPGEIAQLAAIALPTVGLVNNAQREHQEFMASVEAVARENGAVLAGTAADGAAVFPADDPFTPLWTSIARQSPQRRILTFGLSGDTDVRGDWRPSGFGSAIEVKAAGRRFAIELAAAGEHNVRNALAAIACALAAGIDEQAIIAGLSAFRPVAGRLQQKAAPNGATVIDDTYNANPDSVRAAIDVLAQAPSPRVLVLGDMGEVGNDGPAFHAEIGGYAKARGIDGLLAIGELARHATAAFGAGASHFDDIAPLGDAASRAAVPQATLLVKGSRFMKMERIVSRLTQVQTQESH